MQAFTDYTTALVQNERLDLALSESTWLHEMKFPSTRVTFYKIVTLLGISADGEFLSQSTRADNEPGLNSLTGFNITSFTIKVAPEADGTNMVGQVVIPNPTIATIEMGNVTFNNYVDGTLIGTSLLTDLVLRPGDNSVPMRSVISQPLVLTALTTPYRNGIIPIDVVGNSSVYEGKNLIYFEKALQGNTQRIELDVGKALVAIGLNVP